MLKNHPVVLCFSGHDPSGGAGVQADIETLTSHHCHCASVITALTEQDSCNIKKILPQTPKNIISQANTLFDDMAITAIKIGLVGYHETARAIHTVLQQHPDIPVVFDPVLAAGGGTSLANAELIAAMNELLLPCTTVLTPNSHEARQLAGQQNLDSCGLALLDKGCEYVLITGSHETSPLVENQLFHQQQKIEMFSWERLPASYHGSGCTLASSIAASLAQGLDVFSAITEGQDYTWNTLDNAYKVGKGQHNPNRFFWVEAQ